MQKIEERILAVYPTRKGFAYLILESPSHVLFWANTASKDEVKLLKMFESLVENWAIDRIVTESFSKLSKRSKKAQEFVDNIKIRARKKKVKISSYGGEKVSMAFDAFGAKRKYARATLVAEIFNLKYLLPPKRKIWESESERMPIFDCGVLLMTHLYYI